MFTNCPKCGAELEVKRSGAWRMSVEGDCATCKIHFTTSTFWEKK